jgi:hypothetical protein
LREINSTTAQVVCSVVHVSAPSGERRADGMILLTSRDIRTRTRLRCRHCARRVGDILNLSKFESWNDS